MTGRSLSDSAWVAAVRQFERTSGRKAAWQLANTVVPYLLLLGSMLELARRGSPLWGLLVLPAAGFLVRAFGLFHDCVHGSFVGDARLCRIIGRSLGVLVFTPYGNWRHFHLGHHASAGDLDRRNTGDIWTLTVEEYRRGSRWQRLNYRAFRSPLVMFGLGPLTLFLFIHRLPGTRPDRRRIWSVLTTNLAIGTFVVAACLVFGVRAYLLVQLAVFVVGGGFGVWLFYVQHQFSPSYWARNADWSPMRAALEGSSYYKLPKVLQWLSANIGLHHLHHLCPRIPNYNLQACLDATPELRAKPLTFRQSLAALKFNLWDEQAGRFVSFRDLAGASGLAT
ncbi:MAG TPA: fatty acid desaturase [Myxococcales bacterium]|jgi:omega-6 fatty acid desaturase (delta-12 desaturase)